MEFSLSQTDLIAIYAAIVATLVLVWDVYKFLNEGPKLRITVRPHMVFSDNPNVGYVHVSVCNNGSKVTTLESLTFSYWPNRKALFTNKKMKSFVAKTSIPGIANCTLPFELEPGKKWSGFIRHNDDLIKYSSGLVYIYLHHSFSSKPVLKRLLKIQG